MKREVYLIRDEVTGDYFTTNRKWSDDITRARLYRLRHHAISSLKTTKHAKKRSMMVETWEMAPKRTTNWSSMMPGMPKFL